MKWITLAALVVGSSLMGLAIYIYPSTTHIDAGLASRRLAELPLSQLRTGSGTVSRVRVPDSEQWRRLTAEWGAPDFIAAVAPGTGKPEFLCFPQAELDISVTDSAGHSVPTSSTRAAPYGYTSRCGTTGIKFAASPGSELLLHVTRLSSGSEAGGELVVMPYWRYEKDRLVGDMIAPGLRRIALGIAIAGLGCLGACVWFYRRQLAANRRA